MVALYLLKAHLLEDDTDDTAGAFLAPQAAPRVKSVGLGLPFSARLAGSSGGSSGGSGEAAARGQPG